MYGFFFLLTVETRTATFRLGLNNFHVFSFYPSQFRVHSQYTAGNTPNYKFSIPADFAGVREKYFLNILKKSFFVQNVYLSAAHNTLNKIKKT